MLTVVYSEAIEPLTVVEIKAERLEAMKDGLTRLFATHEDFSLPATQAVVTRSDGTTAVAIEQGFVVRLRAVRSLVGSTETWMIVTDTPKLALRLRPALLAGQSLRIASDVLAKLDEADIYEFNSLREAVTHAAETLRDAIATAFPRTASIPPDKAAG